MNYSILVTRPNHDRTTRYASAWANQVIEIAESKQDIVFNLEETRATRKNVESVLNKKNPDLVFLNGHGGNDWVAGQDNEVLLKVGENEKFLFGKIVYALACQSGRTLGPASILAGARAFIGYQEDFIFTITSEKRTRPLEDRVAGLYFGPSNQIVISLLKGHLPKVACENSRKASLRNIQKLLTSETSLAEASDVRYLYWNAQNQVCHE